MQTLHARVGLVGYFSNHRRNSVGMGVKTLPSGSTSARRIGSCMASCQSVQGLPSPKLQSAGSRFCPCFLTFNMRLSMRTWPGSLVTGACCRPMPMSATAPPPDRGKLVRCRVTLCQVSSSSPMKHALQQVCWIFVRQLSQAQRPC